MQPLTNFTRLSLNQATLKQASLREVAELCARAGIPALGLWRDKVAETGLRESACLVRDLGLSVSSLCRGGWFPAASAAERQQRLDDNRRAIEEAAELGTSVLVLVCGPAPDRDIAAARTMVQDAIAALLPYAAEHNIKLGIEPLHPMFAADRSVIVTLAQANQLVEHFDTTNLGVVIDVYHVWWDPDISSQIARASGHILGFHVCDWLAPPPDHLNGRGMMGDGVIEIRRLRSAVEQAGYTGPIEVEIFNQALWQQSPAEVLTLLRLRYLTCV